MLGFLENSDILSFFDVGVILERFAEEGEVFDWEGED